MGKIEYKNIIRSINDNQFEILDNILKLYNNGEPFECDPTYSSGGYYKKSNPKIEEPKYKFDVYPISDGVTQIEALGKWPLDDNSVQSVNVDLPFVISPHGAPSLQIEDGNKRNIIYKRFVGYYPKEELFESYQHFIKESFRVLKPSGILVWKTQRTITGGKTLMTPEYSFVYANNVGFYTIDRFTLIAKNRLWSGKIKTQQHSRSFDSQFYVFQKPDGTAKTKPIKFLQHGNS